MYFKVCQRMRWHSKSQSFPVPARTICFPFSFSEPALTIPFLANRCPNKLAQITKYLVTCLKILLFCYFVTFLIVLVTPFNKILESPRA